MAMSERMSRIRSESAVVILGRAEEMKAQGRPVINLGIGAPDFRTPDNIVEAGRKALADGWHGYTPAKGIRQLRETVAWDAERQHGATIDPENLLVVPGGKPTMFFAMLMLGERGVEIMYPDPGFPIYHSMIDFSGATAIPIAIDASNGFSIDPEQVLAQINDRTRLLILNSPGNPTGGVIGREELDALVAGLSDHPDVYVMSDEIYSRIVFGDTEFVSMLEYPEIRDRLILLHGWSKNWAMPGWRLGWGLWPDSLIDGAETLQINANSCAMAAAQVAAIEALRGPQEAVIEMRDEYEKRTRFVAEALDALPGMSCQTPRGAFYVFPNIGETGLSSEQFEERLLEEADVAIVSGTSFGDNGEGHVRVSCAASMAELEDGVTRIERFLMTL
ncbi:MAG: pyridoxal phosphate-dependent aminotransferase [Acidimicrobiia bacterium]|nr:pyridoxal phosphate-dependent aminotransferase [Acidimicrobiia bacterium]